jgi:serine/threonine-protein kinase HipA
VTATPVDDALAELEAMDEEVEEAPASPAGAEGLLRFSLAGVQLKLSMLREREKLILPVTGRGGNWIVKLPSPGYPYLPENEHATMTWAERAGIHVAEHELVPLDQIDGVPSQMLDGLAGNAYVTRRYDRLPGGRCVHQEDFAQVQDAYPERKYKATNHETIANVALRLIGPDGLKEFLRRLVFVALSGNGDAHLKNWSLYYPDDVHAKLSPAYDLVATIQYIPGESLALNFARSKSFRDVSLAGFQRLARKLEVDETEVLEAVRTSVAAALDAWRDLRGDLVVPKVYRERIEEHLRELPLARVG